MANIELKIQRDVSLAPLSTFKIGGKAKYYIEITTKEELAEVLLWRKNKKIDFAILAGGSNILIADSGFSGLVLHIKAEEITLKGDRIESQSGASLANVLRLAVSNSLLGMEWAAGIPGSIGGALRGNAGAFGNSMSDIVENVEIYDINKTKFDILSRRECQFAYRDSMFKRNSDLIIWSAICKLRKGPQTQITKKVNEFLDNRSCTQPQLPSAGCVFKNLKLEQLERANKQLAEQAIESGAAKHGMVGTGWIISRCGIQGKTIGGAKISLEHANFIVNTAKASAEDVIMLISFIKQQVRARYSVQLMEELQYLGF